jgi:tetratricopeptide (TPR) repeat protein
VTDKPAVTDKPKAPRRKHRRPIENASRRWCIPTGILREPDEHLEASEVLEEFHGQGKALAYLLWSTVRDVSLWASIDADRRAGLFGPAAADKRLEEISGAALDPALEVPLMSLAAVVDVPAIAKPRDISRVCVELANWALAREAVGTAMAYAQAASLAAPDSAAPAGFAGSVALRWGRHARAETWLRRAIGLGRRAREWEPYALAYVDLGRVYTLRGSMAGARSHYLAAVRAARRHGLLKIRAAALHGLLRIALDADQWEGAERLLGRTLRAYGRGHPHLPYVRHDGAYLWISIGRYSKALSLLKELLPGRTDPRDRALTLALQARAAAGNAAPGSGDQWLYQEAWSSAWSIIDSARTPAEYRRALLELGRASSHLRDWPHVAQVIRFHSTLPGPITAADRRVVQQFADLATYAAPFIRA